MKETLLRLFLLLSLCLLISCEAPNMDSDTSIPEPDNPPTTKQILQQSKAQLNQANTFTLQLDMSQTISEGDTNQESITSQIHTYYNVDPLAYHQTVRTESIKSNSSENLQIAGEQYVTEEGAYMLNHTNDKWMEVPLELTQDVIDFHNVQLEPLRYLDILHDHEGEIQLEEQEVHYKLEVDGEGTNDRELVMQLYNISNLADEQQLTNIVNHMNIESIDYDLFINKETLLLDKVFCNIELNTTDNGDQVAINLTLETLVKDYNETKEIKIPDEIINNAEGYKINLTDINENQ